jgi:hypothetical protein
VGDPVAGGLAAALGAIVAAGLGAIRGLGEADGVGIAGGCNVGWPCGKMSGTRRMYPIDTVESLVIVVSAVTVE